MIAAMRKGQLFSDQLRVALMASGHTRYQVSQATGIPEASLSRFVHGKGRLAMESVDRLCAYLDLTLVASSQRKGR